MRLLVGTWDAAWGYTWLARGFGKTYSLRSLAGGSSLCVDGEEFPTPGEHSCHITLLDKQAVVSDYTSGTLSLFPLDCAGVPSDGPRLIHFEGCGPNPQRQTCSHIHSSWLSPDGNDLIVVDLGADRLYRFQVAGGVVITDTYEAFSLPADCGPRHCAFGKDVLYVATELSDEVLVLDWPSMEMKQRVVANPALPGGGGHVVLAKDYLYVSSRWKDDGIAIFHVSPGGLLEKVAYQRTGAHPRHFCLSPDSSVLAVACRDDDKIQFFSRSEQDGSLSLICEYTAVEKPVYVELI